MPRRPPAPAAHPAIRRSRKGFWALYAEYGLECRRLGPAHDLPRRLRRAGSGPRGCRVARNTGSCSAIGATVGPILAGHLADRAGFGAALRFAFLIESRRRADPGARVSEGLAHGIEHHRRRLRNRDSAARARPNRRTSPAALGPAERPHGASRPPASHSVQAGGGLRAFRSCSDGRAADYRMLFLIGSGRHGRCLAIDLIAAVLSRRATAARG